MPVRQPVRRRGPRELGDCLGTLGKEHSRAPLPRSRDGRRRPAAPGQGAHQRPREPGALEVQLSHFQGGRALSTKRGERCSAAPGAVPSRAEKGEGPEGPLSTLMSGWESQVETQGFMWQPTWISPLLAVEQQPLPLARRGRALGSLPGVTPSREPAGGLTKAGVVSL